MDALLHLQALWKGVLGSLLGKDTAGADDIPLSTHVPRADAWPMSMFLLLSLAQFVLNWGLRLGVMVPLASCLFGKTAGQTEKLNDRLRRKRRAKIDKFAQSAMEAFFYALYFIMGYALVVRLPWFWPSSQWWTAPMAADGLGAAAPLPMDVTCFYVAYAARYLQGLVSVFLETKRKDFWEMVVHHTATIILIYLSFVAGMTRVGLVIMVLLDFADPFLHVAKCCKYVSEARSSLRRRNRSGAGGGGRSDSCDLWGSLADVWFAGFALSFTVTRNIMYPYVVWSCWVEGTTAWRAQSLGGCTPDMNYLEMLAAVMQNGLGWCMLLLAVLQVLQLIWQYFLMKAIVKVILGEDLKDTRSDSESDGTLRSRQKDD